MSHLQGKVFIITGASKGIGKACAEKLAAEGSCVAINYNSDATSANKLVDSIGTDRAIAVQADVSKMEDINKLVNAVVDKFGKINGLILNAGVMPMRNVFNTTEEDFDTTFALNVKGPFFLAQKVVPYLPSGSRIILLSTSICHFSAVTPNYLLYAATKGAVEQITRVLAKDLGSRGILVNAVAPGPTATDLFYKGKTEELIDTIRAANPLNRIGQPEEIASIVKFLCSEDSSWVIWDQAVPSARVVGFDFFISYRKSIADDGWGNPTEMLPVAYSLNNEDEPLSSKIDDVA
ncbi:hypothetical protein NM208_g5931 [Fusarium decemcellulare]|uniref:Uncharacterized protein n=1 Tax=Fusarium decemcellulare TaxID=57161 RepID=A0ACC1SF49_9HYPO|nr:hypothetical protein NM208_g5931 [Fusarium decemcellulare]